MIPIFAIEDLAPPAGFDQWLQCLAYGAVFVAALIHAIRSLVRHPSMEKELQSFRDHAHQTFATKQEMIEKIDAREATAIEFRKEMREDMKELSDKVSARTGEIFDEIRSMGREVSNLEGRLAKTGKLLGGQS